jgi:phospholipid N-methyltransferase
MPASTASAKRRRADMRAAGVSSPWVMFLKGFFKHPVMVGAIASSSQRLVRHMLQPVDWDNCKLFVEYGLKHTIDDPRFIAVNDSASEIKRIINDHGFEHADFIASGLPFSTLPPGVGDAIAHATHDVLRKDGAFLVYQYNPKVRNFLTPYWEHIDHEIEWWNLPPAQLWWAWKK